jgi:hypothetical protein
MHSVRAIILVGAAIIGVSSTGNATEQASLVPSPEIITSVQLRVIDEMDGELVQLSALVQHVDAPHLFSIGEKQGARIYVVVPTPAIDEAFVGDEVEVVGMVRHFNAKGFERDYRWFMASDYPELQSGDWVIVATSARTPQGTQLVPGNTISSTPPTRNWYPLDN